VKFSLYKKTTLLLLAIFAFGLILRFVNFHESVYFGYDEARDAFDSQNIYLEKDLKISGAPASALIGVNHGPVYLYLIGPLFLLGKGDPFFVSAVFRIINALGIFLIFYLGKLYFSPKVGFLAGLIFAVSYEQYIYAIYTGNPSLSNIFWLVLFIGAGIVYRYKNKRILGLFLMFFGSTAILQFDLILSYSLATLGIILFLLRRKLKGLKLRDWVKVIFLGSIPAYTYPLAEIKNNFLGVKTLYTVLVQKGSFLSQGENFLMIFWRNFLGLFRDNILDFSLSGFWVALFFFLLIFLLILHSRKEEPNRLIIVWIGSIFFLLATRGFMPYYSYAGVGIGIIVGFSYLLYRVHGKNRTAAGVLILIVTISNVQKILPQSVKALIVEIKAQPGMKLSDEIRLIERTYEYAEGSKFTIRVTSMPYKVQTVWAYLYKQYGLSKYGYMPYLEGGNTLGYPGNLPVPIKGTTCVRYLIREPVRGIPEVLINNDVSEENLFSDVIKEEKVGEFVLQIRRAKDPGCY
jgi:hypothetical protein